MLYAHVIACNDDIMGKLKQALIVLFILLVLVQSTLLVSAQSVNSNLTNEWTMFRQNPDHTGFVSGNESPNSATLLWRYPTNRGIQSSPAVANGCLFVGSRDSQVYCLNISTGMPIWRRPLGWEVWSSPAIDNERVYVGVDDGTFYALNITNGETVWRTPIGQGALRSSPTLVDGKIYVGSGSGGLYCLDAVDGQVVWVAPTGLQVSSSPAVSGGVAYFACDDYDVYAVNASTGDMLWNRHTGSVQSSPSINDGKVYIGSIDGYLFCLNATNGEIVWQYQTDDKCQVNSSPALAYGQVYVGSYSGSLYCVNASSGILVWKAQTGYWIISSPTVADANVYVGSEDHGIYCFDAFTGQQKWRYETGSIVESSPTVVNNTLFVGSEDYIIYAFALTNQNTPVPQEKAGLNFNIIIFDVIAVAVVAGVITTLAVVSYRDHKNNPNSKQAGIAGKQSWIKAHIDLMCILVILVFSVVFFVFLGNGALWAADEQTYSQWAFHMTKSGDYLTPWCFGQINFWIAKPPLYMWLMSLSYQIFGFSNFSTRLISPIFGILAMVIVYYLGKMLYNQKTGFSASLILGTFATFLIFSRQAMTDVMSVLFITAGIYFVLASDNGKRANWYATLAGVFFGLALMTKQVQAFLLPMIVIIYFLITKKSLKFLFTKRFALFIGVGLLIFVPWVIYMMLQFGPIFSEWYFMYSGVVRATNPIEGHNGGILYYLTYLVTQENPVWVAALPFAIGFSAYAAVKRSKPDTLLIVWIAIVLGLFTFAQTKIYWYILPAFPAFALAIGNMFVKLSEKIQQKKTQSPKDAFNVLKQ
ncbi:MAG: PQQ-binding-like beta-propeller repeat protein [Candidatus Bathyarchaeia archaeon]|jgi:outer membrane protein assembly factor BamB